MAEKIRCKKCGSTKVKGSKDWYKCQICGATVKHNMILETKKGDENEK